MMDFSEISGDLQQQQIMSSTISTELIKAKLLIQLSFNYHGMPILS